MRYEYKFVKVALKTGWLGENPTQDYQDLVAQHAADGWRLVQVFAPATIGVGKAAFFELILERPIE
jgi:hypothetical protein